MMVKGTRHDDDHHDRRISSSIMVWLQEESFLLNFHDVVVVVGLRLTVTHGGEWEGGGKVMMVVGGNNSQPHTHHTSATKGVVERDKNGARLNSKVCIHWHFIHNSATLELFPSNRVRCHVSDGNHSLLIHTGGRQAVRKGARFPIAFYAFCELDWSYVLCS